MNKMSAKVVMAAATALLSTVAIAPPSHARAVWDTGRPGPSGAQVGGSVSSLFHSRRGIAVLPLLLALALGLGMVPVTGGTSFGVGQASHAGMSTGPTADAHLPIVVRPTELPRGPASKVRWLYDNVAHTGSGNTVKMPWTREGARAQLLRLVGRTADGWLVKSFDGDTWTLWSIRDGKRYSLTSSSPTEGEVVNYRLSRNRQRFLVHGFDGDRTTSISVRDLNNAQVDVQRSFTDYGGAVLAFSGSELIVNVTDTQRWDVDAHSVDALGVNAAGADIGHGLLFVTDPATGESGPTSLESSGTPPWTAKMEQVGVSPGGGRVLSRDGHLLTVYNRETGAVRVSFSVRFLTYDAPIWESNRSFVFIASPRGSSDETLVRCRINGSCQRISVFRPYDTISLPPL